MIFDCKGCGVELRNKRADGLKGSRHEFFWQECPECCEIHSYSWLRIEAEDEKKSI